jgi:hypothetical protein
MAQDPRFSNFTESQLYSVLVEIFAATTDFTNYYIGRRAEESFLDSAKLRSSVIMLSKMLGYVIQRPIPATTSIQIKLKTKGVGDSPVFTLPKGMVFSYGSYNYVLKESITYTLTQTDINNFATNPDYYIILEFYDKSSVGILKPTEQISDDNKTPIYLIQGDVITYDLAPSDNPQVNTRYQTYKIADKEFSNLFGSEDYGYNAETGVIDVTTNFTRVGVSEDLSTAFAATSSKEDFDNSGEFYIDRRSFLNDATYSTLSARNVGENTKYCVIRTTMDDSVEVLFADDNIGKIGPAANQHLFVKYLKTAGSAANKIGVVGKLTFCQSSSFGSFSSSDVDFIFRKNITGGSDIESVESMKVNAPGIFYSLDRCVSSKDYVNFLKTLTSPILVKNAIAWGEQEETADKIVPNIKMFNVVLFSILGSMYHKSVINGVNTYNALATENDAYKLTADNNWFNLLVAGDSTTPLKDENYESTEELADVGLVYSKLKNRSQVTVKNVYISPIIKDLKIDGFVYLNSLADRIKTDSKIRNAIYAYLDENADFDIPVYVSNLIELIESFPEVHHADIRLVSNDEFYEGGLTNSRFTSATGIVGVSATYNTDPIGKVYNEDVNLRSVSNPPIYDSYDIYSFTFSDLLSGYSADTKQAILLLLPQLETATYKVDPSLYGSNKFVETDIIWPSKNIWNKKYCRVTSEGDLEEDLIRDFIPSERNFYIGMMGCVYNKLKMLATDNKSNNQVLDYVQKYLSNKDSCVGCSLRNLNANTFNLDFVDSITGRDTSVIAKANPVEVADFLNNRFDSVVEIFRNSFINDLQNGLLDDYSNAVNFSIKNEIARIKAPSLEQYVYYR